MIPMQMMDQTTSTSNGVFLRPMDPMNAKVIKMEEDVAETAEKRPPCSHSAPAHGPCPGGEYCQLDEASRTELAALYEELRQAENGTHPQLLATYKEIDEREAYHREMDKIKASDIQNLDISFLPSQAFDHLYQKIENMELDLTNPLFEEFQKKLDAELEEKFKKIEAEGEEKVAEIVEQLLQEYDRELKNISLILTPSPTTGWNPAALQDPFLNIEAGCSSMDISKPIFEMPVEVPKPKPPVSSTPARRPNDSGRVNLAPPVPLSSVLPTFLLKEAEIADDLRAIGYEGDESPSKNKVHIEAAFTKSKFTYDGKTYKVGEEVSVENREYGRIPAKIESITEEVVSFKSLYTWDVRQIFASYADFQEGRVLVHKKRNT